MGEGGGGPPPQPQGCSCCCFAARPEGVLAFLGGSPSPVPFQPAGVPVSPSQPLPSVTGGLSGWLQEFQASGNPQKLSRSSQPSGGQQKALGAHCCALRSPCPGRNAPKRAASHAGPVRWWPQTFVCVAQESRCVRDVGGLRGDPSQVPEG